MEIRTIKIGELSPNSGQIKGLPKNPRLIRDSRFLALKKSIEDAPEMLEIRELVVVPHEGKYVIICGNMRYKACKDLGYTDMVCKVLPENTSVEKMKEYTIKDNIGFGDDDKGALTAWDSQQLTDWGMELNQKSVKDMDNDEYVKTFNDIKDEDALYPVIPKIGDGKELLIIVSDSEVDTNHVRELLGMNKMKSYKSDRVCKSNVIKITDFIKRWNDKNSNTKPQKGR